MNYANTLFSSGNVLESERVYRQVVKSHPNHVLANLNLANLLISNHKKDEAIIYLDQVIRMDAANERAQALREKVLKSVS